MTKQREDQTKNEHLASPVPWHHGHETPEGATAASPPKFQTDFITIEVSDGRHELADRLGRGERVRVLVVAYLQGTSCIGNNDGESVEFGATVEFAREMSDTESAVR